MSRKRNLSAMELAILENSLKTGETLESLASKAQVDAGQLQDVFRAQGLNLPTADKQKLTEAERKIYMDTLTSDMSASKVAHSQGFSTKQVTDRLKETGLLIPLTQDHQELFNAAMEEGLTSQQAADRWAGGNLDEINTLLGAAGLGLTGTPKKPTQPGGPKIGSDNPRSGWPQMPTYGSSKSESANILGMIPQIPGLRMVRRGARRQQDPNWTGTTDTILTSGQGVSDKANTSVKTLLGS